jgi:hypothetical protein
VTVEFAKRVHSDLPDMRVGRRLAAQVPRFQFLVSGVDVVRVERDHGHYQPHGVDLGDHQKISAEFVTPVESYVDEAQTIPPDGELRCRDIHDAQVGERAKVGDLRRAVTALSAKSLPAVNDTEIVGEQRADLVPAAAGKQLAHLVVDPSRGVLQPRWAMYFREPGVLRVEFGDRGLDVFDVEPHLQRDPTLLVEAGYMEHLVLRRPRTEICSAYLQSGEGKTLATHGDSRVAVAHHARLQITPHILGPLARWEVDPWKADDLPATLDGHVWGQQPLYLVPGLAIDGIDQPAARLHASVGQFDGRGRRLGWLTKVGRTEDAARLLGECGRAFPLVQAHRPLGGGSRPRVVTGAPQNRCQ